MSKFKVKRLTAHILMLKVINDMLKYSFHLTLTQVKLLNLLVKYDNSDSNSASIDRLLKMKEIQSKMALLQMLSYLNNHQWLLKARDQRDQRKLTISINKMHIDKIEYMNNELSDYIERYFGQYTFDFSCDYIERYFGQYTFDFSCDYVSYLLSSQELLLNLKCYLNMCQLSLEELYVLGILNLHKGQLTVKELQGEFHHPIFAVSPILKCLILKGLVKKERCELDERRVIVTIKREKFSKVTMLIQACYNYLEKGIQVKLNNK
ncbi:SarA family transcriptional regulator [Staphylococcus aureus]|nr:SarA family transcriptional regulator [Staphylococcus aureus]MBV2556988.1 SarA family transcriptional regulator [Staphylococcus aureus]MBV2559721.1 SarA family transcriptional regulator [Staphylococcus aureus]MBV2565055.1 SarA family transcriptional regulator [Staphylococcus aureus]